MIVVARHISESMLIPFGDTQNTLWAVLCLCWTRTEDYRLAAPLLPAVGWGLRLCPQDWQQGRLRNGTPRADHNSGKLRYTGMGLTGIELAI